MILKRKEWLQALLNFADLKNVHTERMHVLAKVCLSLDPDDDGKVEITARLMLKELVDNGHGPELVRIGLARMYSKNIADGVDIEMDDDHLIMN